MRIINNETNNLNIVKVISKISKIPMYRDLINKNTIIRKLTVVSIQSTSRFLFILNKNPYYSND